ncbi:putative oxidoreductase YdgJ [Crateriforma conspicua]|uniref:Putative oxidoreductase YdgJ n=2 Tax=Crateriforma conspicua TaxID=2527996 RepID=A0A5C5Y839_9PLAN|nr:putative oxidoreductase YdgJ [Crateriforma conspicua]
MTMMKGRMSTRRVFLARSIAAIGATTVAYPSDHALGTQEKNDRPRVAVVGVGYQPDAGNGKPRRGRGIAIALQAQKHADLVAVCDVDGVARDAVTGWVGKQRPETIADYRRIIDRDDIDAVLIGTPDHWHVKIAVEALRSGKDVYCEKPVTVTIDEGKLLRKVIDETGQVFQVGTQQRSEYESRFLTAIAMVRDGRIGKVRRVQCGIGSGRRGGPFATEPVPPKLDWNAWQGPAPVAKYIQQRCHRTFRFWYEYAGGQITDWGAHHVDIAQWAIGHEGGGPVSIRGTADWNQTLDSRGMPSRDDTYSTPVDYSVTAEFDDGIEMVIDSSRNGITFEGQSGRFFVNRGTLEGIPVDQLADKPIAESSLRSLYGGSLPTTHMANFFDCMRTRRQPISDFSSHHRTLTTCHLANLTLRLDRPIRWDAESERVIGDDIANQLMTREYRQGFEIQ